MNLEQRIEALEYSSKKQRAQISVLTAALMLFHSRELTAERISQLSERLMADLLPSDVQDASLDGIREQSDELIDYLNKLGARR